MNYQNLLCLGDSLTHGARSYGCYPLYLAQSLTDHTPYVWRTINRGVNGYTARNLWFQMNSEIDAIQDTYQACVLIGTNDVGEATDCALFSAYLRQIIQTLLIKRYKEIFCGEIPPIFPDGHIFFARATTESRPKYNSAIEEVVQSFSQVKLVRFPTLTREDYEDSVHFNEQGNQKVSQAFANAIIHR